MSIQDIQANPQDTSNFYLANIQSALTDPNISLPSTPPTFTPPTYGIWVNSLWFLSLVMSLTCALLANLLQQWARKYLKVTRPRFAASEPKRARHHAYYADGVENFILPWVFEALPVMLHLSVFLFFAGLVVFLWSFDHTISKVVISWVILCVALYGYITFIPTFRHDSPYHTPLSPLAWDIVTGIPFLTFRALEWIAHYFNSFTRIFSHICSFLCACCVCICFPCLCFMSCYLDDLPDFLFAGPLSIDHNRLAEAADSHRKKFVQGMQKTAENAALGLQSNLKLSIRAFMRTFDSLHEDDELERFFLSLPGFRGSNDDEDILPSLNEDQKENLWSGLIGLLDRTFSSKSLPDSVKTQRDKICADALDPTAFPYILDSIVSEYQYGPVRSAKIAQFVRRLDNGTNEATSTFVQAIVSSVVATTQLRNDDWFTIASDELEVAESDLRTYTTHDLSLAILIHVTCRQFNNFKESSWPSDAFSKVLRAASKFDVRQSSLGLQRGFCALWNQIVKKAQDDDDDGPKIARFILRQIYKIYTDIHQRTRADAAERRRLRPFAHAGDFTDILKNPLEYPSCNRADHHLDWTPHNHDGSDVITFARIAALVHSTPETSSSRVVATAPRASAVMTAALDPGAAAEDDGKPWLCIRKEVDAHNPPSANRATTANTLDPHSSLLQSVTDSNVAIADRSQEPNAGRVGGGSGDRPPHVSHGWYDIV
jgi:hypothetical protein